MTPGANFRDVICARRYCSQISIGVWTGGEGEPPPKKNFGQQEKFGQRQFLKMFSSFLFFKKILFLPEVGIVKLVKFTRDSGCLARDKLLVISKGNHQLIYIFQFFFLFLGALYCTALH